MRNVGSHVRPSGLLETRRGFLATAGSAIALPALTASQPPPGLHRLTKELTPGSLASLLLTRDAWRPYPPASDRAAWDAIPGEAKKPAIQAAERYEGESWPSLPAVVFLDFQRNGNRSNYERLQFGRRDRLRRLVIAECLEGKGRFHDEVLNGIWLTCEETFWGLPAHIGAQKAGGGLPDVSEPIVDLFAAETSSLLAWTDYLLAPQLEALSPLLRPRIRYEVNRRLLDPCMTREDFGWMGLGPNSGRPMNNWNPWINSNWLASTLLLENDIERRAATVYKILRSLDRFLDSYHDDGGCDEGPGYWGRAGASLFDNLDLLKSASDGRIDFFTMPLVGEIGRYIYRVHIAGDSFVNFADASAKVNIDADLVYRYGKRIGDPKMEALGGFAASRQTPGEGAGILRQVAALFNVFELATAPKAPPLVRDAWFPGTEVMTARWKNGSSEGFYLAAQGGHNAESHNHNDVGNFVVYLDGEPVLIDVGVETYSAKTFSSRRYEIWTMQSAYHNLPAVDGVMQAAGRDFAAREVEYESTDDAVEFGLNIERAYPKEAGLRDWRRTLRLDRRANRIEILDRYHLERQAQKVELSLMTPLKPTAARPGRISLGSTATVLHNPTLKLEVDEIDIKDPRLAPVWGSSLYRMRLVATNPELQGTFAVRVQRA